MVHKCKLLYMKRQDNNMRRSTAIKFKQHQEMMEARLKTIRWKVYSACWRTPLSVLFTVLFSSWAGGTRARPYSIHDFLLYRHATLKCCVCAKTTVNRRNDKDVRKGFQFCFPQSVAEAVMCKQPAAEAARVFSETALLPWSGLRICTFCVFAMKMEVVLWKRQSCRL